VAGGAGARFLAGVLDVDVVVQQDIANGFARFRLDDGAFGAQLGVGQDDDLWHLLTSVMFFMRRA
jgi:hypothetical protein